MLQNYSTNDLILYLYNETELEDSVFIRKAIDNDEEIAEEYRRLVAVHQLIDKSCCLDPGKNSVDAIMAYSSIYGCL